MRHQPEQTRGVFHPLNRSQDPLDHRRLEGDGDELEFAATVGVVLEVDLEDTLEQLGPTPARRPS